LAGISRVSSSGNFGFIARIYHNGETAGVLMSDGKCGGAHAAKQAAKKVLARTRQRVAESKVPVGIETIKQILKEEKTNIIGPSSLIQQQQ